MKKRINWKVLIVSLVIVYGVAFIGGLFTSQNVDTDWYESIKPAITPPNWVFPIVWNVLFFLIALSLYFVWIKSSLITFKNKQVSNRRAKPSKTSLLSLNNIKKKIIIIYGVNFLLNVLWSVLFFSLKQPRLAFYELILLWASILCLIIFAYKIDRKASYLLVPYLSWVSFAGVLNWMMI